MKLHGIAMSLRAAGRFGALTRPARCVGKRVRGRPSLAVRTRRPPPEPDQREMPERRHRRGARSRARRRAARPIAPAAPSGIPAASRAGAPSAQSPARTAARPGLGAEMIDQDDLAAGLGDARELVERRLRIGHGGDDVLRHHHVEEARRESRDAARPSRPAPRHGRACAAATRSCALRSIGSE